MELVEFEIRAKRAPDLHSHTRSFRTCTLPRSLFAPSVVYTKATVLPVELVMDLSSLVKEAAYTTALDELYAETLHLLGWVDTACR